MHPIAPLLGVIALVAVATTIGLLLRTRKGRVRTLAGTARLEPATLGVERFGTAGAVVQFSTHPFAALFRGIVRPRLGPPTEWEDARPPRFAQGVGLFVVGIGLVLHLVAVPWALVIAGAAAFIAAFLNAAFGFCLGCELYLLLARVRATRV